jgi:hypothetical protein
MTNGTMTRFTIATRRNVYIFFYIGIVVVIITTRRTSTILAFPDTLVANLVMADDMQGAALYTIRLVAVVARITFVGGTAIKVGFLTFCAREKIVTVRPAAARAFLVGTSIFLVVFTRKHAGHHHHHRHILQ